jgi:hypothetical protein
VSATDLSRRVAAHGANTGPAEFESIIDCENSIRHNLRRGPAQNHHTTRLKSGAISRWMVAYEQRAEIFALPFAFLAIFCGYSVLSLRLCGFA